MKALVRLSSSPYQNNISSALVGRFRRFFEKLYLTQFVMFKDDLLAFSSQFLRKNQRPLRLATLELLLILIRDYGGQLLRRTRPEKELNWLLD